MSRAATKEGCASDAGVCCEIWKFTGCVRAESRDGSEGPNPRSRMPKDRAWTCIVSAIR